MLPTKPESKRSVIKMKHSKMECEIIRRQWSIVGVVKSLAADHKSEGILEKKFTTLTICHVQFCKVNEMY